MALAQEQNRRRGLLARLRVRKKLIVLHTFFSLVLATMLLVALRPTTRHLIAEAEAFEARRVIADALRGRDPPGPAGAPEGVGVRVGSREDLALDAFSAESAQARAPEPVPLRRDDDRTTLLAFDATRDRYVLAGVRIPSARDAVTRLYLLMIGAILGVYALVALTLEVFVLPEHVYRPIRMILDADRAVQAGDASGERIPEGLMPADELGAIMRSRNDSIAKLRSQERALADALARLEQVAADLTRKNFLLETARRNLVESDRLAGLGLMSAGIAHELNTPLAVLKGLVEKLARETPGAGVSPSEAALMTRVVGRLERLGESLLDYARVRPPASRPTHLRPLTDEAMALVRLEHASGQPGVRMINSISDDLLAACDPDRMVQVLVNLLRNARDAALAARDSRDPMVEARGERLERDGRRWASVSIADSGPGIDPGLIPRLFEPFATTRLDSRGTGLGLAVSEGIVREHAGLLVARNRTDAPGAVFEILLPIDEPEPAP